MADWWAELTPQQRTSAVFGAVRAKHPPDQWITIPEFTVPVVHERDRTGHRRHERRVDVVAVHRWPSHGRVVAYEIKVSREDFAREIEDPSKRLACERLAGECLFAVPQGLVEKDEVPEGWGLLEVRANGTVSITKQPKQRERPQWAWPLVLRLLRKHEEMYSADPERSYYHRDTKWPRMFWRVAGRDLTETQIQRLVTARFGKVGSDAQAEAIRAQVTQKVLATDPEVQHYRKAYEAVKEVLGVDLGTWGAKNQLREALRGHTVQAGQLTGLARQLQRSREQLDRAITQIEDAAAQVDKE